MRLVLGNLEMFSLFRLPWFKKVGLVFILYVRFSGKGKWHADERGFLDFRGIFLGEDF